MTLAPRRFLQRFHSKLDEDPAGEVVGGEDDGAVAVGFLGDLQHKIHYLVIMVCLTFC